MSREIFVRAITSVRRWLGLDGNPIRRRTDRLETAAKLTALGLGLASLPLALAIGFATHHQNMAVSAHEQATRQHVQALVTNEPAAVTVSGGATVFYAQAEWTTGGVLHTGRVEVPATATPESVVGIWTTTNGIPASPPLSVEIVTGRAVLAMFGTVAALALVLWTALALARWSLNRRRSMEWDLEWARISTPWS